MKDDYTEDGHVLVQALDKKSVPDGLERLEDRRPRAGLRAAERTVRRLLGGDARVVDEGAREQRTRATRPTPTIETSIQTLTTSRDTLASTIKQALFDAAFNGGTITDAQATSWISAANAIIGQAQALPH